MNSVARIVIVVTLFAAPELAFARGGSGGSPFLIIAVPLLFVVGWLVLQVRGETWRMIGGFVIAASVILVVVGFLSSIL